MMNPEKMISRRYIDPPDSNLGGSCWNRLFNIQCFFRFWIVNLNVPWTWFHKILRSLYFWPEWTFKTAQRFDRSWTSNVPDLPMFLTVSVRFQSYSLYKKITNGENTHGKFMQTVRNGDRSGTFVDAWGNASERIVENVHASRNTVCCWLLDFRFISLREYKRWLVFSKPPKSSGN